MKRKGFTLVEVLAIIAIISSLALLITPRLLGTVNRAKWDVFNSDLKILVSAATNFAVANKSYMPTTIGTSKEIPISELVSQGYIKGITSPVTNAACNGYVLVTKVNQYKYEYTPQLRCGLSTTINNSSQDSLIAYYKMDSNASDYGLNNLDGLVTNATATNDRFNNPRSALYFSGTGKVNTGYDLSWSSNKASISFWVKPDNVVDSLKGIIGKLNPNQEWAIYQDNNDIGLMYWNNSGGKSNGMDLVASDVLIQYGWTHVVYTWSGSTSNFYINGELKATKVATNASINANNAFNVMIGGNIYTGSDSYFKGAIDDLTMYNRELSASEVSQLYYAEPIISIAGEEGEDKIAPVITLNGNKTIIHQAGTTYTDLGANAIDDIDGDITPNIIMSSTVVTTIVGNYEVTYSVTDAAGNVATAKRTVSVMDNNGPVITFGTNGNTTYAASYSTSVTVTDNDSVNTKSLKYQWTNSTAIPLEATFSLSFNNGATIATPINLKGSFYLWVIAKDSAGNKTITGSNAFNIDSGGPIVLFETNGNTTYAKSRSTMVSVSDDTPGLNSSSLKYLWTSNTTTPLESNFTQTFTNKAVLSTPAGVSGTYYLWILASDTAGNKSITQSNVFNLDNTPPVITLVGNSSVTFVAGLTTSSYTDAGATATDNIDGNLTANIITTNNVSTNVMAAQIVKYNVTDSAGNAATTVNRTVTASELRTEVLVVGGGGGGGMDMAGGGGGGGVISKPSLSLTPGTSYGAVVGAGGAGAPAAGTGGQPAGHMYIIEATNGGNSTFGADTAWGASSAKAGKSCYSLMLDGVTASGVYWIDPDQGGANTPFQVYCDMTYDGGGWTLLLKATQGTTFNYYASYWTTNNTLNPTDVTLNNADAKYRSYNEMPVKDLMARWPDVNSGNYRWVENGFNSGSVQTPLTFFSTANLKFITDAKNNDNWGQNIFSTQADIRFYGFNFVNNKTYNTQANVRWGFGYNENGEGLYTSAATLSTGAAPGSDDVSGGIGMDSNFGNYSAGDKINCCQDTTGMNRSARVEMYGRNSSDTADTTNGIIALGGGAGGSSFYNYSPGAQGACGASGGGTSGYSNGGVRAGGLALSGQGFAGGQGGGQYYSGGGGGAGGAGTNSTGQPHGGSGAANAILGYNLYWGGGGGGASYSLGTGGNGGIGGGGGGAVGSTSGGAGLNYGSSGGGGSPNAQTNTPGGNGGTNTGGGGGGGSHYNSNNKGGNGGSGIVIVKYYGSQKATGGTILNSNGYTIHMFYSSGTFRVNN